MLAQSHQLMVRGCLMTRTISRQNEQANQSRTNSREHVPLILTKITGTCSLLLVGQDEQANQSPTNSRQHVPES